MKSILVQILNKIASKTKPTATCRHLSLIRSKKNYFKFSPYIILKANKDDFKSILKVMHESFYNDEPTCFTLGIKPNAIMDETALKNMAEGLSLVAKCKYDGSIVGAAINETSNPWDPELKEKLANHIKCPKIKRWLLFQAHTQRLPKLWCRYDVQKVFELSNIFVKKGIAEDKEILFRLLEESRALAVDRGLKVFRVNATKLKISDMCEKVKLHLTHEIPYCSFLGNNIPNKSLKVYVEVIKRTTEH